MTRLRGTTIALVRRDDEVAIAGDGQVSLGDTVLKATAKKIRRLHDGKVLAGFAGRVFASTHPVGSPSWKT